ncbi:aldo/keto reductase [Nocardia sp. NPDC101769]|uniref:aldo/keto reductase n=1 Tax=Nocardia sp. NPDC101769 TaxID=3364333 RepID=UPI00382A9016
MPSRTRRHFRRPRRSKPAVALSWLRTQPAIAAPIASARTVDRLSALLASTELTLTSAEVAQLTAASLR